jgi:peptidoglycan/xylan/chitin deacetylase (PgdA/CDA1 family)
MWPFFLPKKCYILKNIKTGTPMKLIKILTIMLFAVLCSINSATARQDIASLCYHQVEPSPRGKFSMSSEKFRQHLAYLKSRNFKSLNSNELDQILNHGAKPAENSVIITFDDGYRTVYDYALPIMKEFGFTGIVCIYPEFIGAGKAMSWEQLKHLISEGWSIECHSMSHANLAKNDLPEAGLSEFLHKEIVRSKEIIERKLHNQVLFMVWPYGCYTQKSIETARQAGYVGAMTVDGGSNYAGMSPWQIKRQVIYANDDMNKFLIRLGMRAIKVRQRYPAPGDIIDQLATFSCTLPDLNDYSHDNYVLNIKVTGRKTSFSFDKESKTLRASISTPMKPGNYFIDVYLRDRKTGITQQNGWLFTIAGKNDKGSY